MMNNYKLKTRIAFALTCCMMVFAINVKAQLTGTKNIPGDYATLALAITDLNTQGVGTGGVTLNLISGNPQTAPVGGYIIGDVGSALLTTASAANPVSIQGNGNTITAAAAPVVGSRVDAIFKIVGADYITLQEFTMVENAANTTGGAAAAQQMTEFGVALFAASTTDGAQFNTIQNNTITLSSATAYQNTFGIFSSSSFSATNTAQAAASTAGTNSNNRFYGNTISGVQFGMYFVSPPQTATVFETGNDIGGSLAFLGNTITFGISNTAPDAGYTNFSGTTLAGICFRNVVGNSARFNTINSLSTLTLIAAGVFSSTGTTPTGVTYTSTVSNNTITLNSAGTATMTGIDFGSGLGTATFVCNANTVTLNEVAVAAASGAMNGIKANYTTATNTNSNNSVTINQSSTGTGVVSGAALGIDVSGTSTTNNVLTNTILFNQTTAVATGITNSITGVKATSAATTLNITTNNVITVKQAVTGSGTYGTGAVAFVSYNAGHTTVNITGNTFNTTGSTIRSTGATDVVLGGATTINGLTTIKNNTANIDRVATGGNVGFFTQTSTSPNDPSDTISSNTITFTNLATSGSVSVINRLGGSTTAVRSVCNNIISVSGTNTGAVSGIVNSYASTTVSNGNSITVNCPSPAILGITGTAAAGSPGTVTLRGNTFSLTSSAVAPTSMVAINAITGTVSTIAYNNFNALNFTGIITSSPTVSGITVTAGSNNVISNNTITNISVGAATSTGNPTVDGIFLGAATSVNVFKNKIYGITTGSTGTTVIVSGIRTTSATTTTFYNNFIGGLTAPAAASTDAIRGINISTAAGATTTRNIYYNTIYLNATSTGANFGTTGLYATTSTGSGNTKLDLRNNIIINNSTPAGTGLTVAYRRSSNTLTNFAATSNNNLYYAGTAGASNLIYSDGTVAAQTLAAYQAAVGAIDAAAKTENVSFLSTTGSSANYLHVNPATPTYAESSAANIATYTDDYDGDIRQGNAGYSGTGTAPDIGADEFAGTSALPLCSSVTAGTATSTPAAICSGGTAALSVTGATSNSTSAGIGYQWVKGSSAVGPFTAISGATNTTLTTTALTATTYYKFVVSCSNSGLTDSAAVTVTVNPLPTISVTPSSATICQPGGTAVALTAAGASTYAWAPAATLSAATGTSVNASPTATTTYSVTGTDVNGCINTGTVLVTVNGAVTGLTATATPSSVCSGANSQLLATGSVSSPANLYQYSTSTGATLDPMTGATTALGSSDDDTPTAAPAAIGFTFNFNGLNYTQFSVSPDGWILLGGATAASEFTNAMTATTNVPKITPYWDDLATGSNGNVTTLVTGTAPNRILKVQWFVTIPRNTTGAANSTFQAWLYEGSGRIEFRYGTMGTPSSGSISGGLTGSATVFHSLSFATNTSNTAAANDANSVAPASGRMYIYMPPAPASYLWTPSTFIAGQEALPNPLATAVTTTTTYTVTASNGGCTSSASVTLTAGAPLTSTVAVAPSANTCVGTALSFSSTPAGGGAPYTYVWTGPNSFTSTLQNPTIPSATVLASGTYTVTVTDNCSATSSHTIAVTVNPLPAVAVTPTTGLYCSPGTAVTLTASAASTYAWSPATGLSAATGTSVNATPANTTTYTVTGTDANGCVATATTTITSSPAVTGATATATPSVICAGGTTNLGSSGSPYTVSILTENFNGAAAGWTTINNSTGGTVAAAAWTLRPNNYATGGIWGSTLSSNDASQFYLTNSDAQGSGSTTNTILQSPAINTVGLSSLTLQFYHYWKFNATPDSGNVEVSTNGITWALANATTTATVGAPTAFVLKTVNLDAYVGNPTLYVRFRYRGAWGYGWAIDNVNITGGASTFTYNWTSAPAGFTSTAQNPTGVAPAASTNYTVTLSNIYGCTATASASVTVNPLPAAPTASGTTICAGTTAALTTSGAGTIGWYTAATAGTHVASGTSFTTPALTTTTTYYVQDSAATGCASARTPVVVTVNPLPTVVANTTAAAVCDGSSVTLTGSGASTYTWTGSVTDGIAFTPVATATYTVTGTDGNGCINTATTTVTVNPLPTVVANSTAAAVCDGSAVTLTGSGASTYSWTGAVTNGAAFIPAATTTYTVTGTDGNGCMNTATTTVTVNALPTIVANSTATAVCDGSMVTLSGAGADTYTWTGSVSDGVAFTPLTTDTYTVTGTDANGCMNTATATVTVNALPTVAANSTAAAVCDGSMVTLSGSGADTYTWTGSVSDGVAFTPLTTDTYTVTGTDVNGCMNTATTTVTVNTLPTVAANSTAAAVCDGSMVTLSGSGADTYTWTGSVTDGVAFTPVTTDTYTVTGTDANGCMNTATTTVTVNTLPTIAANASAAAVCDGSSVTLTGSGATTYTWTSGVTDGTAFTPVATATYTVTGTDGNGCMNTATTTVTVNALPTVSMTAFTGMVCDNAAAFALTGGSPAGGVYSGTGVSAGMFTPSVAGDGTFVITYMVSDASTTCSNSDTASITVSNCTGIANNNAASTIQDVTVYPNPASGMVNISINNANFTQLLISIVDMQGKEVYNELDKNVSAAYSKQINIEGIAKGIYYVRLTTGTDSKVQKLVIQ